MKVRFLKPAQSEVDDAVAWYDSQSRSVGTQFLDDPDRTVRRDSENLSEGGVIMFKWVLIMVLGLSGSVFASENCVEQYKGICRDTCPHGEIAAEGAFIDCDEKQECCVADSTSKKPEAKQGGETPPLPKQNGEI